MPRPKPLLLIILDGFGVSTEKTANPVISAKMPTLDKLERSFPFMTLQASGVAVGLPWGIAGNSEVGHLAIGSGRALYHHLPRIINAVYDGSFFENEALKKAAAHVKEKSSSLHLAGLVSSGSVHSYLDHLYALFEFSKKEGIERVFLHLFTDGRDSPPKEGAKFLRMLEEKIKKEWPQVKFSTVIGRHLAMDRDDKWEKIQRAYLLLTKGEGEKITSIPDYLETSYKNGLTDEFIEPAVLVHQTDGGTVNPALDPALVCKGGVDPALVCKGVVKENDALIFFNFREDSMRELTRAFSERNFTHFSREKIEDLLVITLTEYQKGLDGVIAAFPPLDISWPIARLLGEAGLTHLHIAETEKYAHITYFLNGGREKPFPLEERILIPSLPISRFDEAPEMKADEITDAIIENYEKYDVTIANFANADMVGHSGNFPAAARAAEILDGCLGKLLERVLKNGGLMLITADHGNIELKRNVISGEVLTEHSLNPVPFFLVGKDFERKTPRRDEEIRKIKSQAAGILVDVAPTLLELLALRKPPEMTGRSLLPVLLGNKQK